MATSSSRTEPSAKYYFCSNPVSEACKTGFRSLKSYNQHKYAKHAALPQLLHTPKYPFIPEVPVPQAPSTVPNGPYFTKHPVLNGGFALLLVA